jgi:hypothetical protein
MGKILVIAVKNRLSGKKKEILGKKIKAPEPH